ncbi:MAG TPA: discoidin domain-containing protein [Polyangiales bacterium]|nr:discoidin domain-containing protein [Polyangiales bacterium]
MSAAEPSEASTALSSPQSSGGGAWEWLWRARTIAAARRRERLTGLRRERLRRAQLAAEMAERAIEPGDPLRAGSSLPLALSLYRQAAYWALLAFHDHNAPPTLREALASTREQKLDLSADELAQARNALIDKSFVETADDRSEVQKSDAEVSQRFVRALLEANPVAHDRVGAFILQRAIRSSIAFVLSLVLALAIAIGIRDAIRGPDLARGRPWRSSSHEFECHPKTSECGGAQTNIFFHTKEEDRPWLEIDLGTAQTIARVEVDNRDDCCVERATPLVIEVSDDRQHWKSVARRADTFHDWTAKFDPVRARYVRLRVDRRSTLHLGHVSVRPR